MKVVFLDFVWLFFLDHIVLRSIFTGISKSCGLPPECNIHCYVLDVSMPKHTMHCTPDLVTVSPPLPSSSQFCGRVGDRLTSVPRPIMTCYCARPCLRICSCLTGMHGLKEDNLFKPNSSEIFKKKTVVHRYFNALLLYLDWFLLVIFGCACCYDIILLCFVEHEQCDFYKQ